MLKDSNEYREHRNNKIYIMYSYTMLINYGKYKDNECVSFNSEIPANNIK